MLMQPPPAPLPPSIHPLQRSVELDITLIARRSIDRSGTRHWRRGADSQVTYPCFMTTPHPLRAENLAVRPLPKLPKLPAAQPPGLLSLLHADATCRARRPTRPRRSRATPAQGAAANLVETEQLVSFDHGRVVASYVMVRRRGRTVAAAAGQAGMPLGDTGARQSLRACTPAPPAWSRRNPPTLAPPALAPSRSCAAASR